jgi:L-amino acid N-acyltransferase YncA
MMDVNTKLDVQLDQGELEDLIGQYKYGRYFEDRSLPREGSQRFMLDDMRKFLSREEAKCAAAFSSSAELLGILLFRMSLWDTEHFGFNVAVIDAMITQDLDHDRKVEVANALLQQFHKWCRSADIRFASLRVPGLDLAVIHSLEQWGFRFIETWIYNNFDLHKIDNFKKTAHKLRMVIPEDLNMMLEYSKGAFATQRFHADSQINRDKADSLYEKWIQTAYNDSGQKILVLELENKPAAFMIYWENDLRQYFGRQFIMWKFALLDPANRGKGLGTDFFVALMHQHRSEGFDVLDSGLSMRNLNSFNLHNKLSFKIVSAVVTFHKWL